MNRTKQADETRSLGSRKSNVYPFLPKTNIEHVDSTTIVEKSEMTAEQRALFMKTYADAILREEKRSEDERNTGAKRSTHLGIA